MSLKAQAEIGIQTQTLNPAEAKQVRYIYRYLRSYPQTFETAVKSPLKWQTKDWLIAGSVIAIDGTLYFLDEDINAMIHSNRSDFTHKLAKAGNSLGNGEYSIPIVGAVWLGGLLIKSPKTQDTASLTMKSLLLANGLTSVLKYGTQRYRPYINRGNEFWNGAGFTHHRDSFPSGHTTLVWSIAPILASQYNKTVWVPPLVYTAACVTGYARMHDEKHWSSDVFAGACIGYFTARLVLATTPKLTVLPTVEPTGISLYYNF
jgi:membrane-associated phospholipid phosphatase